MSAWSSTAPPRPVAGLLAEGADRWGDAVALEFEDVQLSYGAMWERARRVAATFRASGVERGDVVAVQLENCDTFADVYFGASVLGAVTAPVNVHHRGAFLAQQLNLVGAKAVVIDGGRADRFAAVAGQLDGTEAVFVRGGSSEDKLEGIQRYPAAVLLEGGGPSPSTLPAAEDPNLVLFTSGTTGASKAVLASSSYLTAASATTFVQKGGTSDDVFWTPLPMYHGNAIIQTVLGPIGFGARGSLDARFSVSRFWERVRAVGATQVSILGAQFTMLWNQAPRHDDADNPVRCIYGAPLPPDIHHAFEQRFGVRYVTAYGLSEAFPMLVSSLDDPPPPGGMGRPYGRFDVRLFDDVDREVPDGEVGEIVCRPLEPSVMFDGYLGDPAATVAVNRNLWFHTGDYGRKRDDGWFEFVDRKKDYIRRRGENVSSWEVEAVVLSHPAVAEVAAFGVPSELTEDEIMIVVRLKSGVECSPEDLIGHCAENMPYFAVPRYVERVRDQLSNDLGKVPKHDLKARGVTDHTWDREAAGVEVQR